MNPRIYKSKATKQAEYREAKKLGMTCVQYREALASGKITPPTTYEEALDTGEYVNRGWFGQKGGGVSRVKATHIASLKPDSKDYVTCCGKFLADVKVVTDIGDVTCGKCRTNYAVQKITPPKGWSYRKQGKRFQLVIEGKPQSIFYRKEERAIDDVNRHNAKITPPTPEPTYTKPEGTKPCLGPLIAHDRYRRLTKTLTCPRCKPPVTPEEDERRQFKKELEDYGKGLLEAIYKPKVAKPKTTLDAVKAMAATIYPSLEEK